MSAANARDSLRKQSAYKVLDVHYKVGDCGAESRQQPRFKNIRTLKYPNAISRVNKHFAIGVIQEPYFLAAGAKIVPNSSPGFNRAFGRG